MYGRMRTESAEKGKNMIDHEKIEQAVRLLLEGMGEDVNREGLIDTPDRIARMYEEIYGGMDEDAGKRTGTLNASCRPKHLSGKYTRHVQMQELWNRTEKIVEKWL